MQGTELFRDEFSSVTRQDDHHAIVLQWFATTKTMTDAQFRQGLERLASLLEQERRPNVLIDVVAFAHQPDPDFSAWRDKNIIPRYNGAGVKKFAFLLPSSAAHTVEHGAAPAIEEPGRFPTAYFSSRAGVDAWFDQP
jgi:hypothetical protein